MSIKDLFDKGHSLKFVKNKTKNGAAAVKCCPFYYKKSHRVIKKEDETYSQRISKPVAMGNSSGVGGTTVMPKMNDGATEIDEAVFKKRAYDAATRWYGKFKKRGDKPATALHKAAGMVRGVKDKDLQLHLSKAKLL